MTYTGRLALNPVQDGETADTVVGAFATKEGTFQLKFAPEAAALRKTLMQKNGKDVTLIGKLRNERKYFVVTSMIPGGTPVGAAVVTPGGL